MGVVDAARSDLCIEEEIRKERPMNEEFAKEILQELISSLEALETQTAAILQFLSEKKPANKKALATCLETASQASSIRWRASRARIDHLLSSVIKSVEEETRKESAKTAEADREKKTIQSAANAEEEGSGKEELETKGSEIQDGEAKRSSEKLEDRENTEAQNAGAGGGAGSAKREESRREGEKDSTIQTKEDRGPSAKADQEGTEENENAA